jgi:hypothetical protein
MTDNNTQHAAPKKEPHSGNTPSTTPPFAAFGPPLFLRGACAFARPSVFGARALPHPTARSPHDPTTPLLG